MKHSRAQVNAEYLSVLGISLLVVIVFLVLSSEVMGGLGAQRGTDEARNTVDSLARAADFVRGQGEGASERVVITLPDTTVFGPSSTYIGRPLGAGESAPARTVNVNVDGSDVSAQADADLEGYFPPAYGTYIMKVQSRGGFVSITPYLVDASTHSVFISMPKNTVRNSTIIIYKVPNEKVDVSVSYAWGFEGVSLSISPSSQEVNGSGSAFVLSFTSNNDASGIYNSQLTISASGADSGANETLRIPITVDIPG